MPTTHRYQLLGQQLLPRLFPVGLGFESPAVPLTSDKILYLEYLFCVVDVSYPKRQGLLSRLVDVRLLKVFRKRYYKRPNALLNPMIYYCLDNPYLSCWDDG